jgi:hypothetical protein
VACILCLRAIVGLTFRGTTGDFERVTRWKRVLELPIEFALDLALLLLGGGLFGHDDVLTLGRLESDLARQVENNKFQSLSVPCRSMLFVPDH